MQSLFHRIGATLAGLLAGGGTVAVVDWISAQMHPMPAGLEVSDREGLSEWIQTLPVSAFLMLLVAWGGGCLVGTLVARRMGPARAVGPALVVELLLVGATIATLASLPIHGG